MIIKENTTDFKNYGGDASSPPPYEVAIKNDGVDTSATIDPVDGRVSVRLSTHPNFVKLPSFETHEETPEFAVDPKDYDRVPPLSIVIMIVGSRGDVQPFIPIGQRLQGSGHRVRIATHNNFATFIRDAGLEFYDIGGDPAQLLAYMVKNPGLMPGMEALRKGDVTKKRKMVKDILDGCWRACYEPDAVTRAPFAADAIIANPPSFAHIHCAEALNIPLQIFFTMPWCTTRAYPHPLVKFSESNADSATNNFISYHMVELMTWQGLGDVINTFRRKSLGLQALSTRSGVMILERLRIPHTFCWSPSLVPKPKDWGSHIDVTGFSFMSTSPNYTPPDDLCAFLAAGYRPIYIGFGSVPVIDPAAMTRTILNAVKKAGVRCLLSVGWGKMGEGIEVPSNVFLLGSVPHDWLFQHVSAIVHHGGAGTTAAGIALGKPTLIVPFFGDQPFWGHMIARSGAGLCIPHQQVNEESLCAAILQLLSREMQAAAQTLGTQLQHEDGAVNATRSFFRHLPLLNMRCDLDPNTTAVWWSDEDYLKLSAFSAAVLVEAKKIDGSHLRVHKSKTYPTRAQIKDPLSGAGLAVGRMMYDLNYGLGETFVNPGRGIARTVGAVPYAYGNIVGSMSEGFRNLPALYGGRIRPIGEVTSFKSGLAVAGKAFAWDMADLFTGIIAEPYRGAKEEGIAGFCKGVGRGVGNFILKPISAGLGLVEHPGRGLVREFQKTYGSVEAAQAIRIAVRLEQGAEALAASTPAQREHVLKAYARSLESRKGRKASLDAQVRRLWETFTQIDVHVEEEPDLRSVRQTERELGLTSSVSPSLTPLPTYSTSPSYEQNQL